MAGSQAVGSETSRDEATSENANGKILTFYSYKGGTGRSMALANVAWMLALNNKRVLVIDWDLEAPGVHRYFHPFLEDKELRQSRGLIDFVEDLAAREATSPNPLPDEAGDISAFVVSLDREGWDWETFGDRAGIDLLPAGQQSASYSTKVNSFQWISFYEKLGGRRFLGYMSRQVRRVYDYILIDSRTGVSDTSGICTVEMPDTLVVCFTLNEQSIRGAANICESVVQLRAEKRKAARPAGDSIASGAEEDTFRIYPVPTRVEQSEYKKKHTAISLVKKTFSTYLVDVPAEEQSRYWGSLQMAYVPVYAFEEIPAVFGDLPDDQLSISVFITRLTQTITQEGDIGLKALSEGMRLKAFEWFQRPSEAKEDAAQMAESTFLQFSDGLQQQAKQVLLRLVQPGRRGFVPQLVYREDLQKGLAGAADALIKANILTQATKQDGQSLQLIDPAILENWETYQGWVQADERFLRWRQFLGGGAGEWLQADRQEGYLLRGDSLEEAKRYFRTRSNELNQQEQQFISASVEGNDARRQLEDQTARSREAQEWQLMKMKDDLEARSRAAEERLEKLKEDLEARSRTAEEERLKRLKEDLEAGKRPEQKVRWYRTTAFVLAVGLLVITASVAGIVGERLQMSRQENARAAAEAQSARFETQRKAEELSQLQSQNDKLSSQINDIEKLLAAGKRADGSSTGKADGSAGVVCHVLGGTGTWTLPGQIYLSVDGMKVGFFSVGSEGSTSLDFPCRPGTHEAIMTFVQPPEAKRDPVDCALKLSVGVAKNSFYPAFLKNGSTAECHLNPANVGAEAK